MRRWTYGRRPNLTHRCLVACSSLTKYVLIFYVLLLIRKIRGKRLRNTDGLALKEADDDPSWYHERLSSYEIYPRDTYVEIFARSSCRSQDHHGENRVFSIPSDFSKHAFRRFLVIEANNWGTHVSINPTTVRWIESSQEALYDTISSMQLLLETFSEASISAATRIGAEKRQWNPDFLLRSTFFQQILLYHVIIDLLSQIHLHITRFPRIILPHDDVSIAWNTLDPFIFINRLTPVFRAVLSIGRRLFARLSQDPNKKYSEIFNDRLEIPNLSFEYSFACI